MNKRLDSLDILRGMTVFLMIMVNNGVGHEQFVQMQHSQWHGLTVCDLVFPFFLFIVGVSAYLALSKKGFSRNTETYKKIATRTVGLFLIGVALHAWDTCVYDPDQNYLVHFAFGAYCNASHCAMVSCLSSYFIRIDSVGSFYLRL